MTNIKRYPVVSSNIAEVGYDPNTKILEVKFLNGNVYQYSPVLSEAYREMLSAPSIGKYFNQNIKTNTTITFTRIE